MAAQSDFINLIYRLPSPPPQRLGVSRCVQLSQEDALRGRKCYNNSVIIADVNSIKYLLRVILNYYLFNVFLVDCNFDKAMIFELK